MIEFSNEDNKEAMIKAFELFGLCMAAGPCNDCVFFDRSLPVDPWVLRHAPVQKSTRANGFTAVNTFSGQFTAAIHIERADRLKGYTPLPPNACLPMRVDIATVTTTI